MSNCKAFGWLTAPLLGLANLIQLFWTVWLTEEQIRTGWGYPTNLELAVLYPWITQLLLLPVVIGAGILLLYAAIKRNRGVILWVDLGLWLLLLLQYGVTDLFIFF